MKTFFKMAILAVLTLISTATFAYFFPTVDSVNDQYVGHEKKFTSELLRSTTFYEVLMDDLQKIMNSSLKAKNGKLYVEANEVSNEVEFFNKAARNYWLEQTGASIMYPDSSIKNRNSYASADPLSASIIIMLQDRLIEKLAALNTSLNNDNEIDYKYSVGKFVGVKLAHENSPAALKKKKEQQDVFNALFSVKKNTLESIANEIASNLSQEDKNYLETTYPYVYSDKYNADEKEVILKKYVDDFVLMDSLIKQLEVINSDHPMYEEAMGVYTEVKNLHYSAFYYYLEDTDIKIYFDEGQYYQFSSTVKAPIVQFYFMPSYHAMVIQSLEQLNEGLTPEGQITYTEGLPLFGLDYLKKLIDKKENEES